MSNESNHTTYYPWYPISTYRPWYYDATLDTVWRLQIAWGQICFILGTVGNIFVLYGTICHNAIKMDGTSIWIIKNLAVADICNCVLVLLPNLLTQTWELRKRKSKFSQRWQ